MKNEALEKAIDLIEDKITELKAELRLLFKGNSGYEYIENQISYNNKLLDILKKVSVGQPVADTGSGLHKHSVKHRCLHCGKPIVFDNYAASWIHKREWKGNDNGYYCDNNKPDIKFTATPNNGV